MADTIITTVGDVHEVLKKTIADLEAAHIEVPASLRLAVVLLGHDAADERRRP